MTPPDSHDAVFDALASYLRKQLKNGKSVHVPDLGTFEVEHRPSEMKKDDQGRIVMVPPQDSVSFTPDA
jgi:nucleoid DNA-binding protein